MARLEGVGELFKKSKDSFLFLQCMRVGQLEPQNKNALPVPMLRQVFLRLFFVHGDPFLESFSRVRIFGHL